MQHITPPHRIQNIDKRIEYIDAMRGLAMFMVVVSHVFTICTHTDNPINNMIDEQFQVPLFFFISGFFIQNACSKPFWPYIWDRARRLVIPAVIVMSLYIWLCNADFYHVISSNMKFGYWFTLVLFGFTIVYLAIYKLFSFIKNSTCYWIIILASAILITLLSSFLTNKYNSFSAIGLISIPQYQYYIYFVLGSICFQYKEKLFSMMNNSLLFGVGTVLFIILEIAIHKYGVGMLGKGALIVVSSTVFIGLLIIWKCFHCHPGISCGNIFGKFLTLIGRRSLDVYFLHYFILLLAHSSWGALVGYTYLQYLIAIALAVTIVLGSLGLGYLIRLSPLLSELMLGIIPQRKSLSTNVQSAR